jgi:hypothetical protein
MLLSPPGSKAGTKHLRGTLSAGSVGSIIGKAKIADHAEECSGRRLLMTRLFFSSEVNSQWRQVSSKSSL